MTNILFGHSYFLRFDPKLWEAMQPYPPLGTLYAAAVMRQHGYEVALFDAMLADSEEDWTAALERTNPRLAVLFEDNFNYLSKMCLLRMRQAAFRMIAAAKAHGCQVIASGADASDHAPEYLAQGADYVLIGEGELTLAELVDRLYDRNDLPVETIQGLAFQGGPEGVGHLASNPASVYFTTRRPDLRDLDSLPFPAWDLADIPRYRKIWLERHGYFSMNLVTTRGCPFHCNWCAKPIWGQRYHTRSPENVIAEMKLLQERYAPDRLWFMDDIFGLKPGWVQRFAAQVEIERVYTPFKCLSRADLLLRPGEIEALRRSGCRIVWIGAESGSQRILDAMDKGTQVEQIYTAARQLHLNGMQVGFFLQFGYPGELREDIEKTLQMVRDCLPDDIGMSVSYPLPGTRFFQAVRQQLGERQNWIDSSDLAVLYRGPYSTEFYRQLHTTLHREYRARQAFRMLGAGYRKPLSPGLWLKTLASLVNNLGRLPLERWRLRRLEIGGAKPVAAPAHMSPEAAARPTLQGGLSSDAGPSVQNGLFQATTGIEPLPAGADRKSRP